MSRPRGNSDRYTETTQKTYLPPAFLAHAAAAAIVVDGRGVLMTSGLVVVI